VRREPGTMGGRGPPFVLGPTCADSGQRHRGADCHFGRRVHCRMASPWNSFRLRYHRPRHHNRNDCAPARIAGDGRHAVSRFSRVGRSQPIHGVVRWRIVDLCQWKDATSPRPGWIPPQLCQFVETAPSGPQWLHEIKLDGFRMSARIERGSVQLLRRRNPLVGLWQCTPSARPCAAGGRSRR
jgi:hypothetical protein